MFHHPVVVQFVISLQWWRVPQVLLKIENKTILELLQVDVTGFVMVLKETFQILFSGKVVFN